MELIDISVRDGKGLITIAISGIKDRIRIRDYFQEADKLFDARDVRDEMIEFATDKIVRGAKENYE